MTKTIDVKREKLAPAKSIQEQKIDRDAAVEENRLALEQPRKDFLAGKGGDASEFFDVTDNRHIVEDLSGKPNAHEETENLSESARERWLRTGELPEKKKPNGKAAEKKAEAAKAPERPKMADYKGEDGQVKEDDYQKALDDYEAKRTEFAKQQARKSDEPGKPDDVPDLPTFTPEEIDKQLDKETYEEVQKSWTYDAATGLSRDEFYKEPEHAESYKSFPGRINAAIEAMSPLERNIVANSAVRTTKVSAEFNRFLEHVLCRVKNLSRVWLVLHKDPGIIKRANYDWERTAKNPNQREEMVKVIRFAMMSLDKEVGKMNDEQWHGKGGKPNGAGKEARKLTQAGKPPVEASGSYSSPNDDGSADAAWRRKDLSSEDRGELYRERKNAEDVEKRRKRYARPRR